MTTYKSIITHSILGAMLVVSPCPFAADVVGHLVQTIDTSVYPSPDPSDIAYISATGRLLDCDGEVDEMPAYFTGYNLFEITLDGVLAAPHSTTNLARTGWSNEPVGCAYNPNNGHLFISDDDQKMVFELSPGSDASLFTPDDPLPTSFSVSAFGDNDPEGLAYDPVQNALYILDGLNAEVYKVTPGGDGKFNTLGDNTVTHFDTESLGVHDPEGIEFEAPDRLYLVGKPANQMAQIYTAGALLRTIDISGASPYKPAGLALGPNSFSPAESSVYITDRGMDNNSDPNENDGKIYEFSVPAIPDGNLAPSVSAGPDQTITHPDIATLNGTMVDHTPPDLPAQVTTTWSMVSGPAGGTVDFGDPSSVDTTASFNIAGTYVLRLTANDGEFSASNDVIIQDREPFNAAINTIFISTTTSDKIIADNLTFADEDILAYNTVNYTWSIYFDGSMVGLGASGADIRDFDILSDGSILLNLDTPLTLPITDPDTGIITDTLIDDSDIVRFIPTSLGLNTTSGSYQLYFDGSDVGLDGDAERLDSVGMLPDGRLVVSTTGSFSVPGVSGLDEDLIAFTPSDLGANTAGTWQMYFDGSLFELSQTGDEDVDGVWIDDNGDIYLNTLGAFAVTGASGGGDDIFKCTPTMSSTGVAVTACSYTFTWDGINSGLPTTTVVDGMDMSVPPPDTISPVVSITAPSNGAVVSGTVSVTANATDNVGVVDVQFMLDGAILGEDTQSPYTVSWNTAATADNGPHNLTVRALDAAGNTTTSTVSVTVNNDIAAPTVSITAPSAGAQVSGTVSVTANATDNTGVAGVQLYLDGLALGREDTTAPYAVSWNTTTVANGAHALTARARDIAGNTALSGAISVNVANPITLTFISAADATIKSGTPVSNYGTATSIGTDNSPMEHFLVKFTVAGIGTKQVLSAKLRLRNIDASPMGGDFYPVANTWTETGVTWNTAPAVTTKIASLGAVKKNQWYEVDIKSLITVDGTYSLRIQSTSSDSAYYDAKESGGNAPQLVITAK